MDDPKFPAAEGVIKYQLEYIRQPVELINNFDTLNTWRTIMFKLGLIGCDPHRYSGYGFGNISHKLKNKIPSPVPSPFLISGTQTGHLLNLEKDQYVLVTKADCCKNQITAEGMVKPSSEALTHAAVYAADPDINWIIHVHSPAIWKYTSHLSVPYIDSTIPYGSTEMANAVKQLLSQESARQQGIFSMLGHQDGIVSFGSTAEQAGLTIIKYLALALDCTNHNYSAHP